MLTVLAAFAVVAQAEPAPIIHPEWTARPSARDLAQVYPDRAAKLNIEGRGTMMCVVTAAGELSNCQIVSEFPKGEGFAEATLKLAPLFRMKPIDAQGLPVAGRPQRIPVRWLLPGTPHPRMEKLEAAMACYGQVAQAAQRDPTAGGAWNAVAFWSMEVAVASAAAGIRPQAYAQALVDSQASAEAGTLRPPAGAELEACLAKVAKG